jgi:hypothetical protein
MKQQGFTLIEALVTGIISVIIPSVILTLLNINNSQLSVSSSHIKLNQVYDLVSEDIHRATENAAMAVQGPGGLTSCPQNPAITASFPTGVVLCNSNGFFVKGYKVVASEYTNIMKLQERDPADLDWKPFQIGLNEVLLVNPDPQGGPNLKVNGYFNIYNGNQGLRFNLLMVNRISPTVIDSLPVQTESVICRNVTSAMIP